MSRLQQEIEKGLAAAIVRRFGIQPPAVGASLPPDTVLGDLAFPVCLQLARVLKKSPREIAGALQEDLAALPGVARVEVAGAGYLNVFLDRVAVLRSLVADPGAPPALADEGKIIVEHTNINPNKAAHIGHLRNAVLGDTLVRALRYLGRQVEVQNYIDDTGVQVADLVVGFENLDVPAPAAVAREHEPFDYFCWDLYARVTALYKQQPELKERRGEVLHRMEKGGNATADLAADLAARVVRRHLATMARLDIGYDLLPRESDILRLKFWARAFELLRAKGAVQLIDAGKNAGCWVMDLANDPEFADIADTQKVLVRSNGTVTYTGKDIAYQLWKFGLLGRDFHYRRHEGGSPDRPLWVTTSDRGEENAPSFGGGRRVYNVIDSRQAFPQKVVAKGLASLGFTAEAELSYHFAYEMVALTLNCAEELGMDLTDEDRARPYVEMSGRRGLGVKADDLMDRLVERAAGEVRKRHPEMDREELEGIARTLAVGALRYFMLRFTRNRVIAFDFDEVLSFEGETGPYALYSVVRATNILRKVAESGGPRWSDLPALAAQWLTTETPQPPAEEWTLARECARLGDVVAESVEKCEMAGIARHVFTLAQTFSHFYHRFPVLTAADEVTRQRRILLVDLFRRTMLRALDLMGVQVPARM
ncbi:MAG: arginine--tRNA ligase [Acidobacteria bacterium]|nr:arginine--tRNA ligase [Acidobacteriota bacterium]